jgi:hypothetical protein
MRRRWSLPQSQREEREEHEDLEPLLEIADDLALVGTIFPTPSFADALERRLLARAGWQSGDTLAYTPGPTSVNTTPLGDDGHVQDQARDHDEVSEAPTVPLLAMADRPSRRASRPARGSQRVSWKVWTSIAAAIVLALTVTTLTVAANASPGTALYGVRRWQEDARTNLAMSDADRAKLHIQYALDALDALDAAVAQHAGANTYDEALGRFTDELRQANDALALVPAGGDHDTVSVSLEDLRARGRQDLRAALPSLSWSARITTTSALGDLGESVVRMAQVRGVRVSSPSGPVWIVTITGSGFQTGAILLVRQRPAGHVVSVTSTQLIAQLSAGRDDSLPHGIGVGNPDNTAASTAQVTSEHDDDDTPGAIGTPDDDDHSSGGCSTELEAHSASCTPTPTSTRTSTSTSTPQH